MMWLSSLKLLMVLNRGLEREQVVQWCRLFFFSAFMSPDKTTHQAWGKHPLRMLYYNK